MARGPGPAEDGTDRGHQALAAAAATRLRSTRGSATGRRADCPVTASACGQALRPAPGPGPGEGLAAGPGASGPIAAQAQCFRPGPGPLAPPESASDSAEDSRVRSRGTRPLMAGSGTGPGSRPESRNAVTARRRRAPSESRRPRDRRTGCTPDYASHGASGPGFRSGRRAVCRSPAC
jgi:hypothetical protein